MTETLLAPHFPLSRLGKIREVLELVAGIRDIDEPWTSPDGFRQAIALVLRFADLVGIDPKWTERVESILRDQGIFNIVLAIVQYVAGVAGKEQTDSTISVAAAGGAEVVIDQQSFLDWLPLVIQLMSLIRQIRQER